MDVSYSVEPSSFVDLLGALWESDSLSPLYADRPARAPSRVAREVTERCLSLSVAEAARTALRTLGLSLALGLAVGGVAPDGLSVERQAAWEFLRTLPTTGPGTADYAIVGLPDVVPHCVLKRMLTESHCDEIMRALPYLMLDSHKFSPTSLEVVFVPTAFLPPAPIGKVGWVTARVGGGLRLILVAGNARFDSEWLDWAQWLRLGVCHLLARRFWAAHLPLSESPSLTTLFETLPERLRARGGIHEFTVHTHPTWRDYALDHLTAASKVICERRAGGAESAAAQARWYIGSGRFHLDWFLRHLEELGLDIPSANTLQACWQEDFAILSRHEPIFAGPLATTESALWNQTPRLIFSPSVTQTTRRTLRLWLKRYWSVPVEEAEVAPGEPDWDARCNLVFAVAGDTDWCRPLRDGVSGWGSAVDCLWPESGGSVRALTWAVRNVGAPGNWTRTTVALNPADLPSLHQGARPYDDWTARTEMGWQSGSILYPQDRPSLLLPN